jgi:hypothetical protein
VWLQRRNQVDGQRGKGRGKSKFSRPLSLVLNSLFLHLD